MSVDPAALDPRFLPWVQLLLTHAQGAQITSTRRSPTEQAKLYRRFLNGMHPYPVLPPGRSMHEHGLAVDLIADESELRRLGMIWKRWGGLWHPSDPIHFEATSYLLSREPRITP